MKPAIHLNHLTGDEARHLLGSQKKISADAFLNGADSPHGRQLDRSLKLMVWRRLCLVWFADHAWGNGVHTNAVARHFLRQSAAEGGYECL